MSSSACASPTTSPTWGQPVCDDVPRFTAPGGYYTPASFGRLNDTDFMLSVSNIGRVGAATPDTMFLHSSSSSAAVSGIAAAFQTPGSESESPRTLKLERGQA